MSKINSMGTGALTALISLIKTALEDKVDKAAGKGLSSNDYTDAEKTKLAGIASGANKVLVVDRLNCIETDAALSANQGKVLDEKITAINTSLAGKGSGDMAKATYDTDGDGVVDNAAKLGGQAASYYAAAADVPVKVSDLTNDSGFQTADQVTAAINTKVSSAYRAGGSVAFASLPAADEAHLGMVYNITDAFTTTDAFLDGAGKTCPAGTNVVIAADGAGYKYDVLAGFVDLSGYVASGDLQEMTADEVTALWNSVGA